MNLEEVIKELGIDQLPEARQQQLIATIATTVHQRVGLILSERMTDEQLKKYDHLIETNPGDALDQLMEEFPEYIDLMRQQMVEVKEDIQRLLPPKS